MCSLRNCARRDPRQHASAMRMLDLSPIRGSIASVGSYSCSWPRPTSRDVSKLWRRPADVRHSAFIRQDAGWSGRSVPHMFNKLLSRLRRAPGAPPGHGNASPYRAVSVIPTRASCPAAVAIMHTRFLIADAPTLPLPMCTWPLSCTCKFRTHEDRRESTRRSDANDATQLSRKDRRQSYGRRATDR